jgi:hypothetical protein
LIVTQWMSSGLGGYLAGRLRKKWVGIPTDEVFFRDTAHGFLAWALATIIVAALVSLASAITAAAAASATATTGAPAVTPEAAEVLATGEQGIFLRIRRIPYQGAAKPESKAANLKLEQAQSR